MKVSKPLFDLKKKEEENQTMRYFSENATAKYPTKELLLIFLINT